MTWAGASSSVACCPMRGAAGSTLDLDGEHEERAIYPLDEGLSLDGEPLAARQLHVLLDREPTRLLAVGAVRAMLLGQVPGESELIPLPEH